MIEREYNVTGFKVKASFTDDEVKDIFLPLLDQLVKIRKQKNERVIVYLAAPPGTGKTTLSLFIEDLFHEQKYPYSFQSISMDGFHFPNRYLDTHFTTWDNQEIRLRKIKGAPETFDVHQLKAQIQFLTKQHVVHWPIYDRSLHDVSTQTIPVDSDIVLIEGNYLLLKDEPWQALQKFNDYSIFIKTEITYIKNRLIERKQQGGSDRNEANSHFERTDKVNAEYVLQHSLHSDIQLFLNQDGRIEKRNQ